MLGLDRICHENTTSPWSRLIAYVVKRGIEKRNISKNTTVLELMQVQYETNALRYNTNNLLQFFLVVCFVEYKFAMPSYRYDDI